MSGSGTGCTASWHPAGSRRRPCLASSAAPAPAAFAGSPPGPTPWLTPPAWRSLNPQLGSNGNWGQATEQEAGSGHRRARRGVRPPSQSDPPAAQQGGCTTPPTKLAQCQSDCTIPPNHQPASRSLPPPCHIAVRRAPAYATLSPLACRRGRLGWSCRRAGRRRRRIITMWFSRRSARRRREGSEVLLGDDGWVLQASDLFVQRLHL